MTLASTAILVIGNENRRDRFRAITTDQLNEQEKETVIKLALTILKERHQPGESPEQTTAYLKLLLAEKKNEVFGLIYLTNQHTVICFEELFNGTIDGTSVYPRVVAQRALELNAAAVIAAHNHPSVPYPSNADKHITQKLKEALVLFDIRFLDHIVVTLDETYSFAKHGLI